MKCQKCGTELEKSVKFCPYCGEKVGLYCKDCGTELTSTARFCPSCGSPVSRNTAGTEKNTDDIVLENTEEKSSKDVGLWEKIKEIGRNLKEEIEKDDKVTEMTDDEYRNKLVKQNRILNIGYTIAALFCIKSAWDFRHFYGWKGGILGFFISSTIISIILWVLGAERYFGEERIRKYDKIKEKSSKDTAVAAMENKKGGGIRIVLLVVALTIGTIGVSDYCCKTLAEVMVYDYLADKGFDLNK